MATREQSEALYMTLAPEVGIIPAEYRNKGYDKLEFAAGEGGIPGGSPRPEAGGGMREFLAGIAAGADPKEFAKELLGSDTKGRRGGRKEASA
jgi:hypothetical protein